MPTLVPRARRVLEQGFTCPGMVHYNIKHMKVMVSVLIKINNKIKKTYTHAFPNNNNIYTYIYIYN